MHIRGQWLKGRDLGVAALSSRNDTATRPRQRRRRNRRIPGLRLPGTRCPSPKLDDLRRLQEDLRTNWRGAASISINALLIPRWASRSAPFEELHLTFVLLGGGTRGE